MSSRITKLTFAILASLFLLPVTLARAEKSAAEILPSSTLFYLELTHPRELMGVVIDHPMRQELEQADPIRKFLDSDQFQTFKDVVHAIEAQASVEWRPALEEITGGGIVLAFEPMSQGAVILIKPTDMKTSDKVREALFALMRDDAKNKGNPDPIKQVEYRDLRAYHVGDAIVANLGPWLMISNKPALAKGVADRYLDGGDSLANDEQFSQAREGDNAWEQSRSGWAFVRLAPLRLFAGGGASWLTPGAKSDNPAAELLLGGLIPIAQNAPYVTSSLWAGESSVKLTIAAPTDKAWIGPERKFFFAANGDGAPRPLVPKGAMLVASAYRDVAAMWQAGPDLFTEAVATQMAQSDSQLSTLFGGKSFSADVLAAFRPQVQLVVAPQDFAANGLRAPAIKFPAAALIANIKPEKISAVRTHFRVGFQSIVAFVNIDGMQKGRPPLEIQTEKRGNSEIQFATYGAMEDDAKADNKDRMPSADMYLNVSPALVLSDKHMMLCSTKQLAEELADLDAAEEGTPTVGDNLMIHVKARPVAELIKLNREHLISQNMLEKGHERAEAEREVDTLQSIVGFFRDATIRLTPTEKAIHLDVEMTMGSEK